MSVEAVNKSCYNPACVTGTPADKKCAGCRVAIYCSKECQRAGWGDHKPKCQQLFAENFDQRADRVQAPIDRVAEKNARLKNLTEEKRAELDIMQAKLAAGTLTNVEAETLYASMEEYIRESAALKVDIVKNLGKVDKRTASLKRLALGHTK